MERGTVGDLDHEQVVVRRGRRSGVPLVLAVHSTALGQAIGGCRLWPYPDRQAALADALRLSAAMTYKSALAGLANGGGKVVVALPAERAVTPAIRESVLHDVGDCIAQLDGAFATGPDVGTASADMATVARRTSHVFCRPTADGGSGDPSRFTADGVLAAVRTTCRFLFGSDDLAGRRTTVIGLGKVGAHISRALADAGADQIVADVDPTTRAVAEQAGARWMAPEQALVAPADVLIPAALGGLVTSAVVPQLTCAAVVGPANNQLAEDTVADQLHRRDILWAPDYLVSAGGIIHAVERELHHLTRPEIDERVRGIGDTLATVLDRAERERTTPHTAATRIAEDRIRRGRPVSRGSAPVARRPRAPRT